MKAGFEFFNTLARSHSLCEKIAGEQLGKQRPARALCSFINRSLKMKNAFGVEFMFTRFSFA